MPWLFVILGYLLGSFPTAYVAGRLVAGKDIRNLGDRNAGAANVFREVGAAAGLAVFLVDVGKGALAIAIAQAVALPQPWVLLCGAAAVLGHNWPVFLGFRGGRGESTAIGVLLTVVTGPLLMVLVPALVILLVWKSVIKASLLFIPLPLLCWWAGFPAILIVYSMALPVLVGVTHWLRTRPRPA